MDGGLRRGDITHYDDNGQALRFFEAYQDSLVFMAVGGAGNGLSSISTTTAEW